MELENRLNGVRPRRPEQSFDALEAKCAGKFVSMESGLEDRNNAFGSMVEEAVKNGLNGVRPRRPEQL